MAEKRINKIILIRAIFLILSLLVVPYCSWIYLKQNTNFLEQAKDLIGEKEQLISNNFIFLWGLGILFFGVAIILQLKDVGKFLYFFITEFVLIIASFMLVLGIFIENLINLH